ncbi:hypothetical protein AAKU64_004076 [Undibacterium sp. GrIS 1.8]|uniref:hypothetical protein n=1 Tax=Undibacterium sp. GrIS 1.8 TaxID=3143934 RepID=UPI00339687D1
MTVEKNPPSAELLDALLADYPICTPTCPANYTTNGQCPPGQIGQTSTTTTYTVINGTCTPSQNTDWSGCTTPCNTTTSNEVAACDPGKSGYKTRIVSTNSCTGSTYGAWDTSGCINNAPAKCANGASDYPTCTPTCPSAVESLGTCPSGLVGQTIVTTSFNVVNGVCVPTTTTDKQFCTQPCTTTTGVESQACDNGYTGNQSRIATSTCPSGVMSYSGWDTSGCVAVACPASTSTTGVCPAGFTGQTVTTTNYVGVSCTAVSSTDSSGCTPLPPSCTSSTSTETAVCPAGQSGNMNRQVTTNSCNGTSYSPWDKSNCTTNAPTCAPPRFMQYGPLPSEGLICVRSWSTLPTYNPLQFYPDSDYHFLLWFDLNRSPSSSDLIALDQSLPLFPNKPIGIFFIDGGSCNADTLHLKKGEQAPQSEFIAPADGWYAHAHSQGCN